MTVDFHVHSTASDGTCAPEALAARTRDFAAVALTDHDNTDGVAAFRGPNTVAGIELSIDAGEGFDRFHLLGLGVDGANPRLVAFLDGILRRRNERNGLILANFARIGIPIAAGDIARYANGKVLARPHFARWLVDHGHAVDVKDAFAKYLLADSPAATRCYVDRVHPSQEESFDVVHGAGGLCVMAHPKYWRDDWKRVGCDYAAAERELAALKERGLDGLEALYQANTVEENVAFVRLADRVGLLKSAGSDFHGANKPDVRLGMQVDEAFIAPLLERLRK